jgi:hypothetical protein
MLLCDIDFTWLLSLSMWGVDVEGLAYPLHCPMTCDRQSKDQGFLSGAVLSYHVTVGGDAFPRGVRSPKIRYLMKC